MRLGPGPFQAGLIFTLPYIDSCAHVLANDEEILACPRYLKLGVGLPAHARGEDRVMWQIGHVDWRLFAMR